jgi:hypothetical protein
VGVNMAHTVRGVEVRLAPGTGTWELGCFFCRGQGRRRTVLCSIGSGSGYLVHRLRARQGPRQVEAVALGLWKPGSIW